MSIKPYAYLVGGYQSPDVILIDPVTGIPVPLGGMGGPWDTVLQPDKKYDFSANVNFDGIWSLFYYYGTMRVRFWAFDGGVGATGVLLDTQNVSIDSLSDITNKTVTSAVQFQAAPLGMHRCAVVSISNLDIYDASANAVVPAKTCADAADSSMVPDPGSDTDQSCSAWRNTESTIAPFPRPWHFGLGMGPFNPKIASNLVELEVQSRHVPKAWFNSKTVRELRRSLGKTGVHSRLPLFLWPTLRETFEPVNLRIEIESAKRLQPGKEKSRFLLDHGKIGDKRFEVSGILPKQAGSGDLLLVDVVAHYKDRRNRHTKSIGFLDILYVIDKKYSKNS